METPVKQRKPRKTPEERPLVSRNLSLVDVEAITGLKIVDVEERKNTLVAILANGVRWHIKKKW